MERAPQTPSFRGTGILLLEINHKGTLCDHMAYEERITYVKCLLTFVNEMA